MLSKPREKKFQRKPVKLWIHFLQHLSRNVRSSVTNWACSFPVTKAIIFTLLSLSFRADQTLDQAKWLSENTPQSVGYQVGQEWCSTTRLSTSTTFFWLLSMDRLLFLLFLLTWPSWSLFSRSPRYKNHLTSFCVAWPSQIPSVESSFNHYLSFGVFSFKEPNNRVQAKSWFFMFTIPWMWWLLVSRSHSSW